MLKVMSILGAGTLAVSALWGFLLIAAPSLPTQPPADKVGPALAVRDLKPRGVVEQPRAAALPETLRVKMVKPVPQPAMVEPAPQIATVAPAPQPATIQSTRQPEAVPPVVATPVVMLSPTPPGGTESPPAGTESPTAASENPQEPDEIQDVADRGSDLVGAAKPMPIPKPRPSVGQVRTPRCTRNRSYNAATQTYRGFDGVMHRCRS